MSGGYFTRVAEQTPTRFWVNNPTVEEARMAIRAGAVACTTNPTFAMKMLTSDVSRAEALRVVYEAVDKASDDHEAVDLVQQALARPIMEEFLPLFKGDPRRQGFVSLQGNPCKEDDPDLIVNAVLLYRRIAPNFIAKVPMTAAGLAAMEAILRRDVPVIATEVMAIRQAVDACETYQKVARETGKRPAFFVTHITGIFDEYLRETAARDGLGVSPQALEAAGTLVARKQYELMARRGYPGIMLGGGARGIRHFTEFVGGKMDVTINWKGTADALISQDGAVECRMDAPLPPELLAELLAKAPDFRKAYLEDGLGRDEYEGYGPVKKFRDSFVKGWTHVLQMVRLRRSGESIA